MGHVIYIFLYNADTRGVNNKTVGTALRSNLNRRQCGTIYTTDNISNTQPIRGLLTKGVYKMKKIYVAEFV